MHLPDDIREQFRVAGRSGGLTAAANMTPEQRQTRARKAAKAAAKARTARSKSKTRGAK